MERKPSRLLEWLVLQRDRTAQECEQAAKEKAKLEHDLERKERGIQVLKRRLQYLEDACSHQGAEENAVVPPTDHSRMEVPL